MAFRRVQDIKDEVSIVEFLQRLGYPAFKTQGKEHVYFSMIDDDGKHPSFRVDNKKRVWTNSKGKGGSIIDLAIELFATDVFDEIIAKFNDMYYYGRSEPLPKLPRPVPAPTAKPYVVHDAIPVGHTPSLTEYLDYRGIKQQAFASGIVKEVFYARKLPSGTVREHVALGWKNMADGWELKTPETPLTLGPKRFTQQPGIGNRVNAFESMFDYLSAVRENADIGRQHLIVLNSVNEAPKAIEWLRMRPDLEEIDLYFDHDKAGRNCTATFQAAFPHALDKSSLYGAYKDYNAKIMADIERAESLQFLPQATEQAQPRIGARR